MTKRCCTCKEIKEKSEFTKAASAPDGLAWRCKACRKNEYNYSGKEKERVYKRNIEKYGISLKEFEELNTIQGNVCAICKSVQTQERYSRLSIDHCHTTGQVRGLLCDLCNRGLGYFKDNVDALSNAIKYLQRTSTTL